MIALISLTVLLQTPASLETPLWREIAGLEGYLLETLNENTQGVAIFTSDPARAYHVPGQGVIVVVPVRHRAQGVDRANESADGNMRALFNDSAASLPSKPELERQVHMWKQNLRREAALKDSNFERIVRRVKALAPLVLQRLPSLPSEQSLTIIVEEREPAYSYGVIANRPAARRQVVTLRINPRLIAEFRAAEQTAGQEWLERVERVDASRAVAPLLDE